MEQESSKLAPLEPISDNIDRDWLLQHLVTHANRTQDFTIPYNPLGWWRPDFRHACFR